LVQFAGESRRSSSDNKHSGGNETDHLRASSRLGLTASPRRPTHCKCHPRVGRPRRACMWSRAMWRGQLRRLPSPHHS
jgi:hypothetical protein